MSNVARAMIRAYFGITNADSNQRLKKIRQLREQDEEAAPPWKRARTATTSFTPFRRRPSG